MEAFCSGAHLKSVKMFFLFSIFGDHLSLTVKPPQSV